MENPVKVFVQEKVKKARDFKFSCGYLFKIYKPSLNLHSFSLVWSFKSFVLFLKLTVANLLQFTYLLVKK